MCVCISIFNLEHFLIRMQIKCVHCTINKSAVNANIDAHTKTVQPHCSYNMRIKQPCFNYLTY